MTTTTKTTTLGHPTRATGAHDHDEGDADDDDDENDDDDTLLFLSELIESNKPEKQQTVLQRHSAK